MKTKILLVLMALFFISAAAYADDVPQIVIDGMNTFKTSGFDAAFNVWLKGSPLESDKTTTMNLKGGFTQIESMYGKMKGYEIIKTIKFTSSSTRVYAELRYEKGPVFMFVDCYKSANNWIIPRIQLHTEAEKIFPQSILK